MSFWFAVNVISMKQEKKMSKKDFALKYESGEFDNEETPQRVQKELDNRSRALFGMKTPATLRGDDEILKEVLGIHQGNVALIETVEKAIALTRKECEKGENNQTYVKGYKNGQSMNNDVRYFEMGQKEERERIFEMIDKRIKFHKSLDSHISQQIIRILKELKKEIMQDDRT